jgi:hypothetical protein
LTVETDKQNTTTDMQNTNTDIQSAEDDKIKARARLRYLVTAAQTANLSTPPMDIRGTIDLRGTIPQSNTKYPQNNATYSRGRSREIADNPTGAHQINPASIIDAARADMENNRKLAMQSAIHDERVGGGTSQVTLTLFTRLAHFIQGNPECQQRIEKWIEEKFLEEEKEKLLRDKIFGHDRILSQTTTSSTQEQQKETF